jgi:hypothetical protein
MRKIFGGLLVVSTLSMGIEGCVAELEGLDGPNSSAGFSPDVGLVLADTLEASGDTRTVVQSLGPQDLGFEAMDHSSLAAVVLRWDNFSTLRDCYDIYRRPPGPTVNVRIASMVCAIGPNTFTDWTAEAGVVYTYEITGWGGTRVLASDTGVRATANLARLSGDITYSTCTTGTTTANDVDRDGLRDSCEYTFANAFKPQFIFAGGKHRTRDAWTPYWAVRPAGSTSTVSIFYAPAYAVDEGDGGIYEHFGDTEFVVVEIEGVTIGGSLSSTGTYWRLKRVYLSAHWAASTDGSRWVDWGSLSYADRSRGRPRIYVAYSKHGNFASLRACERGGFILAGVDGSDYCGPGAGTSFTVSSGSNINLVSQPVEISGRREHFTAVSWPFCGWNSSAKSDRRDCVGSANSYGIELARWQNVGGRLVDGRVSRSP